MHRHTDFFDTMHELMFKSRRELKNEKKYRPPIELLRLHCYATGPLGIMKMARSLKERTGVKNGKRAFHLDGFKQAACECGLNCNDEKVAELYERLDRKGEGFIVLDEMLDRLRPPMSPSRQAILEMAYAKMDPTGKGFISVIKLKNSYSVKLNSNYLNGDVSKKQIVNKFINNFEGHVNGKITKDDFFNYYATVSASTDSDAYFDLLVRREYDL